MEPIAPDWRTIGVPAPPAQGHPGGTGPRPAIGLRGIWVAAAALLATVMLGALVTLLLMPTTGGVVIEGEDAIRLGASDGSAVEAVDALAGQAAVGASTGVVVDVEGAVARPGLVRVPAGGRVGDALDLAGGFGPTADLAAAAQVLNLAQEATDGLKILVPSMGDAPVVDTGRTTDTGPASRLVDLNRATEAELDGLPGVGPATIAKIVAARDEARFASVEELRSRGIVGEATFGKLRDLVTVGR